jgi:hypothetical protein
VARRFQRRSICGMRIAPAVIAMALAAPAALGDVVRLADGQVISGTVDSCRDGDVILAPPAGQPVVVKSAEIASAQGADIERCLGGRGRWYGLQILLAEASSIGVLALGAGIRSDGLAAIGLLGVGLSPAIVHAAHGRPGAALGSLGLHIGLGVAGTLIGAAAASCDPSEECPAALGGAAIGLAASQIVATVFDVASLGYEPRPEKIAVGLVLPDRTDPSKRGLTLAFRF